MKKNVFVFVCSGFIFWATFTMETNEIPKDTQEDIILSTRNELDSWSAWRDLFFKSSELSSFVGYVESLQKYTYPDLSSVEVGKKVLDTPLSEYDDQDTLFYYYLTKAIKTKKHLFITDLCHKYKPDLDKIGGLYALYSLYIVDFFDNELTESAEHIVRSKDFLLNVGALFIKYGVTVNATEETPGEIRDHIKNFSQNTTTPLLLGVVSAVERAKNANFDMNSFLATNIPSHTELSKYAASLTLD